MAVEYPIERLDGEVTNNSPTILVAADVLATDLWPDLVSATQTDYRERGVVIGRHLSKNILTRSKIIEGYGREQLEDSDEILEPELSVPLFPFGIKSLLPWIQQSLVILTHPMPPEVDHVKTSIISDKDMHAFVGSEHKAMVMLDRGGAHLLARTRQKRLYGDVPRADLVSSTIHDVAGKSGGSLDAMSKIASRLGQYGLGYFFTPELTQPGEAVEFQSLRVA